MDFFFKTAEMLCVQVNTVVIGLNLKSPGELRCFINLTKFVSFVEISETRF